jgi:hypothetical protein
MDAHHAVATPPRRGGRGAVVRLVVLVAVVVVVVVVVCLALAVVAVPVVGDLTACGAAERRVFAEVPHYGGARPRPSGNGETGSCMATYRAGAAEDRVLAHYRQALGARGWTVRSPVATAEGREFRSGELTARRGTDTTTILYESGPALVGGGTHVAVHVRRD